MHSIGREWARPGWTIVIGASMGAALGYANLAITTVGFFVLPLGEAAGWHRNAVTLVSSILSGCAVLSAPLAGSLADRFGPRYVAATSALLLSASFVLAANAVPNLISFYLAYAAIGLFGAGLMPPTLTRAVIQHFRASRGLALGVVLSGIGVGAAALPLLLRPVIDDGGAVAGYYLLALLALVPLPFLLTLLPRNRPEIDITLDDLLPATPHPATRMLIARIIVASVLLGVFTGATWSTLVPLLHDRQVNARMSAATMSGLAMMMTVSRLATGILLDRLGLKRVVIGMLLPPAIGLALLASGATGSYAMVGALLMGVGIGAEFDLLAFLVASYLPTSRFGRSFGLTYSAFNAGGAMAPILLAWSVNRFGGYSPMLYLMAFAILVAVAIVGLLPDPARDPATLGSIGLGEGPDTLAITDQPRE